MNFKFTKAYIQDIKKSADSEMANRPYSLPFTKTKLILLMYIVLIREI